MAKPILKLAAVSNLLFRQSHFLETGDEEVFPAVKKDVIMLLAKGKILLDTKNSSIVYTAPQIIYLKQKIGVSVKALTENSVVYAILPIKLDSEEGFVAPEDSLKTPELFDILNDLVLKDENS
jgi:hypothetical protein